jgi:hypothetical protein
MAKKAQKKERRPAQPAAQAERQPISLEETQEAVAAGWRLDAYDASTSLLDNTYRAWGVVAIYAWYVQAPDGTPAGSGFILRYADGSFDPNIRGPR